MKIQDIKDHLFSTLEPFAEANGFRAVKSRFALSRKADDRTDEIFFLTNSWGFEVQIFPCVSVDFRRVTEICNECGFHLNHSVFINLLLLQEIEFHGFNPDMRWKMQVEERDRLVLSDEYPNYDRLDRNLFSLLPLALKFFSENHNIKNIDQLYNQRPINQYSPYCSGLDTHSMVGIISARLADNPQYDEIKRMYQRIVKKENFRDEMKSSFSQVIKLLDEL